MVEFRRAGGRVLLVERNTRFQASSDNPLERASVREAFAESVLWAGDIVGTSQGEMMASGGPVKGSGGYVAIEEMKVSLKGRSGTFTLMHHATMKNNTDFRMLINVVPDSGTGELAGLEGVLTIVIEGSKHSYTFDYTLPDQK